MGLQSVWGTIAVVLRDMAELSNEPPEAGDILNVTTVSGAPLTAQFEGTDDSLEADQLTYILCTDTQSDACLSTTRGSVHINGSTFTYTPNLGATGTDFFHYHAIVCWPAVF